MAGLYIHIPFCKKKCYYCDFFSLGARSAPWDELIDALLAELRGRERELVEPVTTLYIGGGTPSLIPQAQMERLVAGMRDILGGRLRPEEFTVEVNPDDVTPALVDSYLGLGVNRVSMGIQSFCDRELRSIGRRHDSATALRAYELLRRVGNVSIDLIFGLPGQTIDSWQSSVDQAISLHPEHISAYSLMWEEGTALSIMRRQGRICETHEELSVEMYEYLSRSLKEAGYEHYEISNYALPGSASRHNSSYWLQTPYLGLGPSAHSYDGSATRRANPADLQMWLANPAGAFSIERLTPSELQEEFLMTRLRMSCGVPLEDYGSRFGAAELERLLLAAAPALGAGHLLKEHGSLILSADAVMQLDAVLLDLLP